MADYDNFSCCYDMFTDDIDYAGYTDKVLKLFEKYDRRPTLMLDLACGTGSFSFEIAKRGIEVIGVDRSEGMLVRAVDKLAPGAKNPLFLNQSAEELELFGTVDGAICMLDSLNHITDRKVLEKVLKKVSLFLEKDRLFIFDLNTEYKHREVLGDNIFVRENENAFCVWQNRCQDGKTVDIFLDLFLENEKGNYRRLSEDFSERAYSETEILQMLNSAGFEKLDIIDPKNGKKPEANTQRILYIVRKK